MRKKAKAKSKSKASSGSKFWSGLLLGGAMAAAALHFGPGWFKEQKPAPVEKESKAASALPKSKNPSPPQKTGTPKPEPLSQTPPPTAPAQLPPPVPKAPGGHPFFRDPARAAYLLNRLEMGESWPGSLLWKKADALGWNAFGILTTPGSPVSTTPSATGNSVTCLLESKRADRVESLRLTANIFSPKGKEATLAKFSSLAQVVLNETRCPVSREFLDAIGRSQGLQAESAEGRFTLALSPVAQGSRWELTVESK